MNLGRHPSVRLFLTLMACTGIIGTTIVLFALYLMTTALDRHMSETGNNQLSFVLSAWTNALTASTEDFAFQDLPHAASTDGAEIAPDFGVEKMRDFDWIAILDSNANVVYGLNLPKDWDAAAYFGSAEFRPVLDQVGQNHKSRPAATSGVLEHNGNYFLAATKRIFFDDRSDEAATPSFFISGRNLDVKALEEIAVRMGGDRVLVSATTKGKAVALEGPLGIVGYLTWDARFPGVQFRQNALPWVTLVCCALILLAFWMAHNFRSLTTNWETMHKVATTDQLTGVANRAALTELLQKTSVQDAMNNGGCAVISLDLDDFKGLNDEHGHQAGDRALKISAERIRDSLRHDDCVVRMGGDEFVCLVFDPNPAASAQKVVDRLKNAFMSPMDLGECCLVITPSIGIAISKRDEDWDTMLGRSDAAMYLAKRSGFERELCLN